MKLYGEKNICQFADAFMLTFISLKTFIITFFPTILNDLGGEV